MSDPRDDYSNDSPAPDIFEIKRAERQSVPALITLWGPSSGGKTYTALLMARGLVGPQGKIGLIDTENGRSLFYSELAGGWDRIDLQPPFTTTRYLQAFQTFERAGYGCIIVDSLSHVWLGEGGVLDQADKVGGNGLNKWRAPKTAYNKMVNTLLRSGTHAIFCLRAKEGVKQTGGGASAKVESVGAQPICGKGWIYEQTVAALLGPDHCPAFQGDNELIHCDPLIPALKAPEDIRHIFKIGSPLSIETGQQIAAWVSGGTVFDAGQAKLEREARNVCSMGTEAYGRYWKQIGPDGQKKLLTIHGELKSLAADADRDAPADPSEGEESLRL